MPEVRDSRGFTLIELLVVLVLVGLLAAIATLTLGGSSQLRQMDEEVRNLYLLMQTASEQAILNNQELGFALTDDGYQFLRYEENTQRWTASKERIFASRPIPDWITVTPVLGNDLPRLPRKDDDPPPDIVFFSSGESTPFELDFTLDNDTDVLHSIRSDGVGPLTLVLPSEPLEEEV